MEATAKQIIENAKDKMQKSVSYLETELISIRTGKANPAMLSNVEVDYYGTPTPLQQVTSITSPDARTISIQPWEKTLIPAIEKAILASNLGFNPQNNGEIIRISVPPLTEERRKDLVKTTRAEAESTRVTVRNIRRDAIDAIKKLQKEGFPEDMCKDFEQEAQKATDEINKAIDNILAKKEQEIMTV